MSVKVKLDHFSGAGRVFTRTSGGLAPVLRDMLIEAAQTKVFGASLTQITDNTGGTAANALAAIPALAIATASGTLAEGEAAVNTSLGKIENAIAVYASTLNGARKLLGLPLLVDAQGAIAAANTLPALDLTGTGAAAGSTADYATGSAAATAVAANVERLVLATDEVLVALGQPVMLGHVGAGISEPFATMATVGTVATDASTGAVSSVLVTGVTSFLAAVANAMSTLAVAFNSCIVGQRTVALTDNSGGTAAAALAVNASPAAVAGAATTSAPKAGFDTQLGVIANSIASLASAYNTLAREKGFPTILTDSSGGTASTTLAAISAALVAVNGSTGTVAVDEVSALAAMAVVDNALSSIGAAASTLAADKYNTAALGTDALGGVVSTTLAAVGTTAAGVGAATGNITLLDTAVDTWLGKTANNVMTLAKLINAMNTMVVTT